MIVYSPNNSSSGKGASRYHRPRAGDTALAFCSPRIVLNDDMPVQIGDDTVRGMLCLVCFPIEPTADRAGRAARVQPDKRRTHHERCAQPLHDNHVFCQLLPVAP